MLKDSKPSKITSSGSDLWKLSEKSSSPSQTYIRRSTSTKMLSKHWRHFCLCALWTAPSETWIHSCKNFIHTPTTRFSCHWVSPIGRGLSKCKQLKLGHFLPQFKFKILGYTNKTEGLYVMTSGKVIFFTKLMFLMVTWLLYFFHKLQQKSTIRLVESDQLEAKKNQVVSTWIPNASCEQTLVIYTQ